MEAAVLELVDVRRCRSSKASSLRTRARWKSVAVQRPGHVPEQDPDDAERHHPLVVARTVSAAERRRRRGACRVQPGESATLRRRT
jgi:hypothetical protein